MISPRDLPYPPDTLPYSLTAGTWKFAFLVPRENIDTNYQVLGSSRFGKCTRPLPGFLRVPGCSMGAANWGSLRIP